MMEGLRIKGGGVFALLGGVVVPILPFNRDKNDEKAVLFGIYYVERKLFATILDRDYCGRYMYPKENISLVYFVQFTHVF